MVRLFQIWAGVIFTMLALGCGERNPRSIETVPKPLRPGLIRSGMSAHDVEEVLRKPDKVINDPDGLNVSWVFFEVEEHLSAGSQLGGVTVIFREGLVYRVIPIEMYRSEY